MWNQTIGLALLLAAAPLGLGQSQRMNSPVPSPSSATRTNTVALATLGGGCFWCVEAVFQRIHGVKSVTSGYAGGQVENPSYEDVCTGQTGHAEVIQVAFDPAVVSYEQILEVFWLAHDPTTLNRQGNDVGPQYRSVIFCHDAKQKEIAERSKAAAAKEFSRPIVTQIAPLTKFYKAENYHQSYFNNHAAAPYCAFVIRPKLDKVLKKLSQPGKPAAAKTPLP